MAFGRKKEVINYNQSNVAMLATEALAKSVSYTHLTLPTKA